MDEKSLSSLRSLWHPLLAVCLPFAFIQAFDALFRLGVFAGIMKPSPPGFLAVVVAVGFAMTILANILHRERIAGFLPKLREGLVFFIVVFILLMALSGLPFKGDFDPSHAGIVWPLLFCFAQWLLTYYAHGMLRERELYLGHIAGKRGRALFAAVRAAPEEAAASLECAVKLKKVVMILGVLMMLVFVGLAAGLALSSGRTPTPAVILRVCLAVFSWIFFLAVMNRFISEHESLSEGVVPDAGVYRRILAGSLAGVGVIFLASIPLSGRTALLPLSLIADFFARIGAWLNRKAPPVSPVSQPISNPTFAPASEALGIPLPQVNESPVLVLIVKIVGIALLSAAALGVLYVILRPLFSCETMRGARNLHPLRVLKDRVIRFLLAISRLPGNIARWVRSPRGYLAAVPRAIRDTLREAASENRRSRRSIERAGRVLRGRALREFQRLARWGERKGIVYRSTEGPLEYARALQERVPEKAPALEEAAGLFEELVYAVRPLRGQRELSQMVGRIVR
jgi:hypothetical protein